MPIQKRVGFNKTIHFKIVTDMNSVKLIGNVGREINVKEFEGRKLINFSLATNESYKNRNNEEIKNTAWHNIVASGQVATQCETLLVTGKTVQIEGKLNYRQYQNKDNITVKVTEIFAFKVEEVVKKQEVRA
jgi:single-strand DNA-binding protein